MRVRRLYISPGHNYFHHHGQPAGQHPIQEVTEIACVAGKGIVGDRFFDYKPDYKGQITFFAWETLHELWNVFPALPRNPAATRRNVILEGAELNGLINKGFQVQGIDFLGVEECRPCYWMDEAFAPGAEAWLRGRGGLRAKILSDGILHVDE